MNQEGIIYIFNSGNYEVDKYGVVVTKPIQSIQQSQSTKEEKSDNKYGLGDLVGSIATPIARLLNLPCIDPKTRELREESPCAKRKAALNKMMPLTLPQSDKSDSQ